MLFWYENGLKWKVFHSFANSKGKMVNSHLEKYGKILYHKIALRVWVPTQQTVRDFEFSSLSYVCFTKNGITWARKLEILRRLLRWNPT